ncbi:ankyrin repeat domain-containing protein, partial [Acinetobacter baumannii]
RLATDTSALHKKYTLNCTFTPLFEASLLHICAEYNHLKSAEILIKHGADINAKAGVDENGFGGHTPVFHTVNQDANKSVDTLKLLLAHNAD